MTIRGRLKIYFGYSAGVGKTYRMLKDAHEKMRMGVDIIVGYIEPNTNEETMELVEGLEILPAKIINNGRERTYEFNLVEALMRRPRIILIDEMAHANAVGSKNSKRYQDIEEVLLAGIDVYTTLNVNQIESLTDVVTGITNMPVEEIISDFLFDCAERVEFVDLEPLELINRYKEGKFYKQERGRTLVKGVIKKKNLDLLREISIKRTMQRINECIQRHDSIH